MWIQNLFHVVVLLVLAPLFRASILVEAFGGRYQRMVVQGWALFSSKNRLESDGPWADFSLVPPRLSDDSVTTFDKPQQPRPRNVQFVSPLLDYGHPPTVDEFENGTLSEKPLLLYLPGFDGTYICPFIQFPELGTEFELWCMTVGMSDRSTFAELKACVLDFIDQFDIPESTAEAIQPSSNATNESRSKSADAGQPFWSNWFANEDASPDSSKSEKKQKRSLYLAGESFGGILASEIALSLLEQGSEAVCDLKGLVLVNPATCYDRSQLAAKGPPVTKLPSFLYPFGLWTLLPLFTDAFSLEQLLLILQAKALPSVIDDPIRESYMGRVAFSLPTKLEYMAQDTLAWRLEEWLDFGCGAMEDRMRDFRKYKSFRTLLLVGEKDLTLPSIAEAERLANLLPNSEVHVVEGAGHASTCGSRVDLAAQMRRTFIELRDDLPEKIKKNKNQDKEPKRTTMKVGAAAGAGPYFGMEPRYDGASIGLNPILYWARSNHRAMEATVEEAEVSSDENKEIRSVYRKISYRSRGRPSR